MASANDRDRIGGYDDFGTSRIMGAIDRRSGYGAYHNERDAFASRHDRPQHRGALDRVADEIASWLGDTGAEQRRVDDLAPYAPDAALMDVVTARLTGAIGIAAVKVIADRGVVTLSGRVATLAERENAERRLADIPGLRAISNQLEVGPLT